MIIVFNDGAVAQLEERLHGMQEVGGSTPLGSTIRVKVYFQILRYFEKLPFCANNLSFSSYSTCKRYGC